MIKRHECGNCITNDYGLCDCRGILVDDDDYCCKWQWETWKDRIMRLFMEVH